jgi:Protein of unknown function (DUF3617)
MKGHAMRRFLVIFAVGLCATPALALDMPARKPGLWQLTMSFAGRSVPGQVMKECIDAATDKMMRNFGGSPQENCSKQSVSQSGGTIIVDSVCSFAGASTTSHSVITGDFNSDYTMQVTSTRHGGPPIPGEPPGGTSHMTMKAKWLGPCGNHRPGDIIMSNGMTMNIFDLQKMRGMGRPPQH